MGYKVALHWPIRTHEVILLSPINSYIVIILHCHHHHNRQYYQMPRITYETVIIRQIERFLIAASLLEPIC